MSRTPKRSQVVDDLESSLDGETPATTRKRRRAERGEPTPMPKWLDGVDRDRWKLGEESLAKATPGDTIIELLAHDETTTDTYFGVNFKDCPAPNLLLAAWRALRLERVPADVLAHHAELQRNIADLQAELATVAERLPKEARRGY